MNNEQTQAEKLAEAICNGHQNVCGGPYNDKYEPVTEEQASSLIANALTQATTDLRAEVEKLTLKLQTEKAAREGFEKGVRDAADERVKIAQEGREKAEAQVAALVEGHKQTIHDIQWKDYGHSQNIERIQALLKDTQATAAAHDASVREAAVRECVEKKIDDLSFYGTTGGSGVYGYLVWVDDLKQALLPNQNEQKEGV